MVDIVINTNPTSIPLTLQISQQNNQNNVTIAPKEISVITQPSGSQVNVQTTPNPGITINTDEPIDLNQLVDVSLTDPLANQVLLYNGSQWVNAILNEAILPQEYDHIQFALDSDSEVLPGRLVWNAEEGTLDLGMNGGDVTQHIGLENYYRVKNQSGSTITDGTVVMAVGAVGNSGHILIAPANNNMPPQVTMGIVTHNIPNGENGFVTHFGLVKQIDTRGTAVGETWVDGDILYLHPTLLGRLTKVKPAAPRYHVMVALVVHAHQNGQLFVRPTYGQKLDEIDDVQITNAQHGQVLKYDSATQTWRNQADNATGDDPEVNSVLTYNENDDIIRIDYDSGNYKLFSYDLEGNLSRLDYVKGSVIYRKDYVYTNGLLTQVNDSVVGV
jgi:hypothetical protein